MEYRSKPFHACIKVSAIAALLLAAFGIYIAVRRRKKII